MFDLCPLVQEQSQATKQGIGIFQTSNCSHIPTKRILL